MRDCVELSTCEDVFLLAPEILIFLRGFLYMGDLFNCPKRKTRTSNSDSETSSPEGKRACNEQNFVDAFRSDAITDNNQEAQALAASRIMDDVTKQLKLILCKLDGLETKLETVIETINNLKTTVNKLENVVDKVQGDAKKLSDDIYAMDKGVSFLNSEVQELRSKERVHLERIKGLENQIIYQELYNRRENLRFLGVPESMANEEDTKEVIYQLLERELNIEEVREIEFQRIHRIGKKSNDIRPIIARFLRFQDREYILKRAKDMSSSLDFKVLVDLLKEIRDRRKAQWPKLKKARDEGKTGYFSWREPDKLYINGVFVPM